MRLAIGHGRSYGLRTRVLGRTLPSILHCGLWTSLVTARSAEPGPGLRVVVADIGNDLGYGVDGPTILRWVDDCLERLVDLRAEITLSGIPAASLDARTDLELALFRRLLFPSSRTPVDALRAGIDVLADGLPRLAAQRGCRFVEPDPAWYGLDPVHPKRRARPRMWRTLLADWERPAEEPLRGRLLERLRCRFVAPLEREVFGLRTGRTQPAGSWAGVPLRLF